MISAVPPPDDAPDDIAAHTVLSLNETDELNALNRRIQLRATVVHFVLECQESQGPGDDADIPMKTLLREALEELVVDIRIAAAGIDAVMARAKGGA